MFWFNQQNLSHFFLRKNKLTQKGVDKSLEVSWSSLSIRFYPPSGYWSWVNMYCKIRDLGIWIVLLYLLFWRLPKEKHVKFLFFFLSLRQLFTIFTTITFTLTRFLDLLPKKMLIFPFFTDFLWFVSTIFVNIKLGRTNFNKFL